MSSVMRIPRSYLGDFQGGFSRCSRYVILLKIDRFFMSPQRCKANLDDRWRLRLEQAIKRHKIAKANCVKVLDEFRSGLTVPPDGSLAVRHAVLEETAAREEHIRVLRIFMDLTIHGKIPNE
jgi:hypothetical protein